MKIDLLNSFLDFNKDGNIDASEEFMGFMMFQESTKKEPEEDEDEDDE